MFTPGASSVTLVPKLENEASASFSSLAPTVIATDTREGEKRPASRALFPAATPYVKPLAIEFWTARSRLGEGGLPGSCLRPPAARRSA